MLCSAVLLTFVATLGPDAAPPAAGRLAIIRTAPDFTLITHDGKALHFHDLKGKVLLVSFMFTTCNGTCPATTHRLCQVQEELRTKGFLRGNRVELLSISLDPVRDTPEVLRHYMRLFDVDSSSWKFLTGPAAEVAKTIAAWGMWVRPAANGQLDHPSRIFLVDQAERVREIYNLNFLKPAWVAEDIQDLLSERAGEKH